MENQLLNQFLKFHSIEDVLTPVKGELMEFSTSKATFFYGNGELIISPADDSQDDTIYVVETIGFNSRLVEY